jgi:hypothetical protein
MFDTLLLRPSLHYNTPLHFTQLHFATLIDASLPLIYTSLPFHLALRIYISCRSTCHITSHHITSHHITRHSTDLILKIISKKVNSFTVLKKFSPFHFTFYLFICSMLACLITYNSAKPKKVRAVHRPSLPLFL